MVSPKVLTPVSVFTAPVTTPATNQEADEAAFEATVQALLNRTEFLNDNLGGGPTLAVNEVWGRRSTGIAEGKASTDFSFDLLALASAVAHADATHTKGADIPSATTTNIAAATGMFVHITGTTTITAFGSAAAGVTRVLRFAAALTLTHNATTLILPSAANIVTAANDVAVVKSEGGGNWRVIIYQRASGAAVGGGDAISLRGVDLTAGVGTPTAGDMIYFDGADYAPTSALVTDGVMTATDGIGWGLLKNANIDAAALIAVTKLAFGTANQVLKTNVGGTANEFGLLADANIAAGALIDIAKLGPGAGDPDEVVVIESGGATVASSKVLNVHVDASAAIAGTKIDPDFGAQTIETTGDLTFGAAATAPTISQTAVVDALGETMSLLGQSNNSATLKAGDLVIAAGTNAGAGADGVLTMGSGTTQIEIDGTKIGFFTVTPITRPDVTGSRGANAALASVLTELENLGLITDSSS